MGNSKKKKKYNNNDNVFALNEDKKCKYPHFKMKT